MGDDYYEICQIVIIVERIIKINVVYTMNIIWFLLNGMMNYLFPDEPLKLGLPDNSDKIFPDGVEFKYAITSAASIAMSISASLPWIPCYHLGTKYDDFFN